MADGTGQEPDGGWIADELDLLLDNAASLIRITERLLLVQLEQQQSRLPGRHLRRVK